MLPSKWHKFFFFFLIYRGWWTQLFIGPFGKISSLSWPVVDTSAQKYQDSLYVYVYAIYGYQGWINASFGMLIDASFGLMDGNNSSNGGLLGIRVLLFESFLQCCCCEVRVWVQFDRPHGCHFYLFNWNKSFEHKL